MKAMIFEEHGPVEVLQYKDIPVPEIGCNDALIKVRASGCNYNDIWARRGLPGMSIIMPHVSGSDAAGVVEAVGSEVEHVKPGDEVIVHPGVSCRHCQSCVTGIEMFCREFKIWGFQTGPNDGAHAEYVRIPAHNVLPKPKNLTWEEAASLSLVLETSWRMLVSRARVQPGQHVLIWGAAGGLGSVAIQICKIFDAIPIAVASSDEKLDACRQLGAEHLINRKSQDVPDEVKKITGRRGVDIVFEHVGEATWRTSVAALKWGGTLVTCGATTGFEGVTDIRFLWNKQMNFLGSHLGTKGELMQALRWVESGHIKPLVSKVLPLREIAQAQLAMEKDEVVGKIVLKPDS